MKSKFIRLGILILVSSLILIWGLSFLKGNDIFSRSNEYHVIYESVDGLYRSNDVLLSGYKVGQVSNIRFLPDNTGRLIVTITVDASVNIPLKSVAQIVSSDIMGTRSIKIILSDLNVYYNENDTIYGAVEADLKEQVSMQVLPLKNKAEELLSSLDSAISGLAFLFDENAQQNFAESFKNINLTVSHIERTTADLQELVFLEKNNIRGIIDNLGNITSTFNQNSPAFENTIQNLSAFSDSLTQVQVAPLVRNINTVAEQLSTLLSGLETTDNTLGSLLNDDQIYQSLEELSDNMNLLMSDIRINPERYLNFSALDLGKKVYVNALEGSADNIVFKIHLVSSQNKVALESEQFKGLEPIEEYEINGAYTYLYGSTGSFHEIQVLQKNAQVKFPDASIVAFKNGRLIKLERALKSIR
jgi:phospholipid/cholesterol/gamma-HCH transport system substrate-binding protein